MSVEKWSIWIEASDNVGSEEIKAALAEKQIIVQDIELDWESDREDKK